VTLSKSPFSNTGGSWGSSPFTGGGSVFSGGGGGGGGVYTPPSTDKEIDNLRGPGSMDVDITNPYGSAQDISKESSNLFEGARNALFGSDAESLTGKHGGLIGDIPVLGDLMRLVSGAPGNLTYLGGKLVSGIAEGISRIPLQSGITNPEGQRAADADLRRRFDAIPADATAIVNGEEVGIRAEYERRMAESGSGLLGTDFLDARGTIMSEAVQRWENQQPGTDAFSGSLRNVYTLQDAADVVLNFFANESFRVTERNLDFAAPQRVRDIMAVGSGKATWDSEHAPDSIVAREPGLWGGLNLEPEEATPERIAARTDLNEVEQRVYQNVTSGEWTEAQAADYLTKEHAGYSHDWLNQLVLELALDPVNLISFGTVGLSKVAARGASALRAVRGAEQTLLAAVQAGDAAAIAAAEKSLAAVRASTRADMAMRLAKLRAGNLGRTAKVLRTVIDPLSNDELLRAGGRALGIGKKSQYALTERDYRVAQAAVDVVGAQHYNPLMDWAAEVTPELADELRDGWAIYTGNTLRRVAGWLHQTTTVIRAKNAEGNALLEGYRNLTIGERTQNALAGMTRKVLGDLDAELSKWIIPIEDWTDDARRQLARKMGALTSGKTEDEWFEELTTNTKFWNKERLSVLDAATYGLAVRRLHAARNAVRLGAETGWGADRLDDLILIARETLTDLGAGGILKRLEENANDLDARVAILMEARRFYPILETFPIDTTSWVVTLERFNDHLHYLLDHDVLPHQVTDAERLQMAPSLLEADELMRMSYTIGFRPKDAFLAGIGEDLNGNLTVVAQPWMEQTSDVLNSFRPVGDRLFNAAGQPIRGARGAARRALNYGEAVTRTAMRGVTGSVVQQAAKAKFASYLYHRLSHTGMDRAVYEGIWEAMREAMEGRKSYSGLRGFSTDDLWKMANTAIPNALKRDLNRHELMLAVLKAYDGDARIIGLTQKLSGKIKLFGMELTNRNTIGEISEHLWPLLKFRFNAFFQAQEKIEPFVMNTGRGASVAFTSAMTEEDTAAAALMRTFVETRLFNMSDDEIAELSQRANWGGLLEREMAVGDGRLNALTRVVDEVFNVQGVKQLNMLRAFRKGLGKEMRDIWEQFQPGQWDRLRAWASGEEGRILEDDEFALRFLAENTAANDILVWRTLDPNGNLVGFTSHHKNAIQVGQWAVPATLGDLKPLHLDKMFDALRLEDSEGRVLRSAADVKRALAARLLTEAELEQTLRAMGAHSDYAQRVLTALRFNWDGFWREVESAYGATPEEIADLQRLVRGWASQQKMSPVEWISQVFLPNLGTTQNVDGIGHLGEVLAVRRGNVDVTMPSLAQLWGEAGVTTMESFYQQFSATLARHLHPSMKLALLREMLPDLRTQIDYGWSHMTIQQVNDLFDVNGGATLLARHLVGETVGLLPLGTARAGIDPGTSGIAGIRQFASDFLTSAGRPRSELRNVYEDNAELEDLLAQAIEAAPAQNPQLARAYRRSAQEVVDPNDVQLLFYRATEVRAVDGSQLHTVQQAIQSAVDGLFGKIVRPRSAGGLGITIQLVPDARPYATADELRADLANDILKVPDRGYFHPYRANRGGLAREWVVRAVYGYGQESTDLDSMHSIALALQMFKPELRPWLLADWLGPRALETRSVQRLGHVVQQPDNWRDYEQTFGRTLEHESEALGSDPAAPMGHGLPSTTPVGAGARALPGDPAREFFGHLSMGRRMFPGMPLGTIDVTKGYTGWATPSGGLHGGTMRLISGKSADSWRPSPMSVPWDEWFYRNDAVYMGHPITQSAAEMKIWKKEIADPHTTDVPAYAPGAFAGSGNIYVGRAAAGTAYFVTSVGHEGSAVLHELSHALESYLIYLGAVRTGMDMAEGVYATQKLTDMFHRIKNDLRLRGQLSQYAMVQKAHGPAPELFAELNNMAFHPAMADFRAGTARRAGTAAAPSDFIGPFNPEGDFIDPELKAFIEEWRAEMEAAGIYDPNWASAAVVAGENDGMSIGVVNMRSRSRFGTVAVAPDLPTTPMPRDATDLFERTYIPTPPNQGNAMSMAAAWVQQQMQMLMEQGVSGVEFTNLSSGVGDVRSILGIADGPVPWNAQESLLWETAVQGMEQRWADVFRLHYFAQRRSVLQRTLNHPMFGLYPASYMWGKVGPELIRFLALEPFGQKTGLLAMNLADIQLALGVQREYDTDLDAKMTEIGKSPAVDFLSYMLPATPWSVPASYPAWMRDLAQQGLRNKSSIENGGEPKNIDLVQPGIDASKRMVPWWSNTQWLGRAVQSVVEPNPEDAAAALSEPTQATDLGAILSDTWQELQALFAQPQQ
jgi:hypothetical protein